MNLRLFLFIGLIVVMTIFLGSGKKSWGDLYESEELAVLDRIECSVLNKLDKIESKLEDLESKLDDIELTVDSIDLNA